VFCATAFGPSAVATAKTAITAVVESQFISQFLNCGLMTQWYKQS
jgi:hypothetical protein